MMDDSVWGMILGKSGRIPGEIDSELIALAEKKGFTFVSDDPHTLYPDALDSFREEMDKNGWEYGQDEEELFELAMHPEQYRNYKSGQAKRNFLNDLEKAKTERMVAGKNISPEELAAFKHAKADPIIAAESGQVFFGMHSAEEGRAAIAPAIGSSYAEDDLFCYIHTPWGEYAEIPAGMGGKLAELNVKPGSRVRRGDTLAWIEREQ